MSLIQTATPRSQVPVKHPISTTATRHSRALAMFLWFRLQAQFLYYIRGKGRLMGRYSKYNEKKKNVDGELKGRVPTLGYHLGVM